ncbi:MAG: tetratricopeptide repeat protein, partial [Pseudoxanthomonas sp.]
MQQAEPTIRLALAAGLMVLLCVACSGTQEKSSTDPRALSSAGRGNLRMAESALAQKQIDQALAFAQSAERSDPKSPNVQLVLAMVHQAAGDERKAERSLNTALRLAPDAGAVLNAHGAWLCEHGAPDKADIEFGRALRDRNYLDPTQVLTNAGKCALRAKRLERAEGYFRQALDITPEDPQLLFLLATTELRQDKFLEARAFAQ